MRLLLALAGVLCCSPSRVGAQEDAPAARYAPRIAPEASLELRAAWEPSRSSKWGLLAQTPALSSPAPVHERQAYAGAAFAPFLPAEPVALGEVWKVDSAAMLAFLRQFHAGASEKGRDKGESPGTYACLRAVSDDAIEILLRAHAVFELGGGVIYKPAQFEGRLVLERESGVPRAFHLELPSRDPNAAAIRRGNARSPARADIGFVPRMELSSGDAPSIEWREEIPDDDARRALRRSFYTFETVEWLPFEEAVLRSRETQKPLHLIVLLGALDDDSC